MRRADDTIMVFLSGILLFMLNIGLALGVSLTAVFAFGRPSDFTPLQLAQLAGCFAALTGPAALLVTVGALCGRHHATTDGPVAIILAALAVCLLVSLTVDGADVWAPAQVIGICFAVGVALVISVPTYVVSCLILRGTPLLRKQKGPACASP